MPFDLTHTQKAILDADGHLLIQGGPGSGKTSISILKAGKIVQERLKPAQRVLFLSFARATVSRVLEVLAENDAIDSDAKRQIKVETYHAFFWRIIKTHGYLLGLPRPLAILTPPSEAVALSEIRNEYRSENKLSKREIKEKEERLHAERRRLATMEGLVCFDLFAEFAGTLLHGSNKIRRLVSNAYPFIILDEFQDTAPDQWRVIQALGCTSQLLALADPEQRIFDFIGADPKRLQHFDDAFTPSKFDLGDENHRSLGTDLTHFGNDILKGRFTKEAYAGLNVVTFDAHPNLALTKVLTETLKARKRLISNGPKDWTLAILVPTKRMTRIVSDAFREPPGKIPKIEHHAAIDVEATILAAEIIAHLLQCQHGKGNVAQLVSMICSYFRGKNGDKPSKTSLQEAARLSSAYQKAFDYRMAGKAIPQKSIFLAIEAADEQSHHLVLTGNPDNDWLTIRRFLEKTKCRHLQEIAAEVRNIRLLDRGTQLRIALSQNWRDQGAYTDALDIVRQAFIREHFANNTKPECGVVIMNMHKAKGKQFDEVIIFEGWPRIVRHKIVANPDRIVRGNAPSNVDDQARQNFRVSITRAKRHTTILTPKIDPCILLIPDQE